MTASKLCSSWSKRTIIFSSSSCLAAFFVVVALLTTQNNSSLRTGPHPHDATVDERRVQESQADNNENENATNTPTTAYRREQGCLSQMIPEWSTRRRVCNSQDDDDDSSSTTSGLCRASQYEEIRIFAQNWESSVLQAWLLQIILSEMLNIPTSIESGSSSSLSSSLNFYASQEKATAESSFEHNFITHETSPITQQQALENVRLLNQDCTKAARGSSSSSSSSSSKGSEADDDESSYQPCAHYIPESWPHKPPTTADSIDDDDSLLSADLVEQPTKPMGLLAQEGWYITKFTAQSDASLTSYLGLQIKDRSNASSTVETRRKLADTFWRPRTWRDYCTFVSSDQCRTPDAVAQRAPLFEHEDDLYFAGEGLYTGHFQRSGKNDCDNHPTACTGHFADYPCSWASYSIPQTFHLAIPLQGDGPQPNSRGYTHNQLKQLWQAANATRLHVIMMWFDTDLLYHEFRGSEAEFIKVSLPPVSQECQESRIHVGDQCSNEPWTRVGSPLGVCDYPIKSIQKLVSSGLKEATLYGVPPEIQSPAYNVLDAFSLSNGQLADIYDYWIAAKQSSSSSPRQALCQWAADNIDHLESSYVPQSYPRHIADEPFYSSGAMVAAICFAVVATLLVLATSANVLRLRERGVMKAGPLQLLYFILMGSLFIALGGMLVALPLTDGTCAAEAWFVNLGFTLAIAPVIVKLESIKRLAPVDTTRKATATTGTTLTTTTTSTAARNARVVPAPMDVYRAVLLVSAFVLPLLIVWTAVDPPRKHVAGYTVTGAVTAGGEMVVNTSYYCTSNHIFWEYLLVAIYMFLLLCATVLTCQTNKIRQDFNEPTLLAALVYCHSLFVMLWLVSLLLSTFTGDDANQTSLAGFRSIVFSFDAMATLLVYFVPKFVVRENDDGQKPLGPVARWISNISGVSSSCNKTVVDLAKTGTNKTKLQEQPPTIPANTMSETDEGFEASLSQSDTPPQSPNSTADYDKTDASKLQATVKSLQQDAETKDRTIALLEGEVETLMEICMNHPQHSLDEEADDSENYTDEEQAKPLMETSLQAQQGSYGSDKKQQQEQQQPSAPTELATFAGSIEKGDFDYGLTTIFEDVDLAQLRDDEAKLLAAQQENQKAAILSSTPRELSKKKKIENAQTEYDV